MNRYDDIGRASHSLQVNSKMKFQHILPNILQISHHGRQRATDAGMQIQFTPTNRKMHIEVTVGIQMDGIVADDDIFAVRIVIRCNGRFD